MIRIQGYLKEVPKRNNLVPGNNCLILDLPELAKKNLIFGGSPFLGSTFLGTQHLLGVNNFGGLNF